MSGQRRTSRSFTITSALLLSTALAAPAFAEIEEVVVTAQKRSEDIQAVPIAVSAFSSQDLAAHQIEGAKDLQFSVPNVTFTHGNFGPSNFQIRGIGSAAVTTSGDSGVSVNTNDVYLAAPPLTSGTFYDLERVEVLRGPQSTLYGRNATGGAINVITAKPDLDNAGADLEITYGNFSDKEARFMVNLPVMDGQLGVRLAGFWENRGGTIDNIFNSVYGPHPGVANRVDSRNDYSVRGSVRWEPSAHTTVDLILSTGKEDDSRVRAQVQLCHRDPSGVLGCLPDKLAFEPLNGNATFGTLFASNVGPFGAFSPFTLFDVADPTNGFFPGLGAPGVGASAVVAHNLHSVDTDFTPTNRGHDFFEMAQWHQQWTPWLNMDLLMGYDHNNYTSRESYNNGPGDAFSQYGLSIGQQGSGLCGVGLGFLFQTDERLACAQDIFGLATGFGKNWSTYFAGHTGTLPISGVGNNGVTGLNIADYSDHIQAYDEIRGYNTNWSGELRFASNFEGPFNFLIAGYHLDTVNAANYLVIANTLDYMGIALGPFVGGDGTTLAPTFYDNNDPHYHLKSNAVFGELYYDVTPDLKLTGGLRYTNDQKSFLSRQSLFNMPMAIGTTRWQQALNAVLPFTSQTASFSAWTGRAVADWSPKIDWTDETHIYASYSRGYRSGGFNPPSFTHAFPDSFQPETVDAFEIGDKNTLLGGTLQANLTGWYYNYKGYQVSEIIDRTSVNVNINAKLWGAEGEFLWAPIDNLQLNMNFGYTHSSIENSNQVDPRNPAADTPGVTLLKDSNGANCVVQNLTGGPAPTPSSDPFFNTFFATAPAQLPGVAEYVAFLQNGASCANLETLLIGAGLNGTYAASSGIPVSLNGNEMPLSPKWTVSVGAQYTFDLPGGYNLVPRVDYYWKDKMWGRIFEDGADRIKSWDVANAQIQLNAPENMWYARAWVQNLFDKDNITGMYITDPSSALFTNAFVGTRRTFGITLGAHI